MGRGCGWVCAGTCEGREVGFQGGGGGRRGCAWVCEVGLLGRGRWEERVCMGVRGRPPGKGEGFRRLLQVRVVLNVAVVHSGVDSRRVGAKAVANERGSFRSGVSARG